MGAQALPGQDNGGTRAEAVHIADTHYDKGPLGTATHVITVGDDSMLRKEVMAQIADMRTSERFLAWRKTVVVNSDIMGGEPVFQYSRLTVRHVAALIARPGGLEEIKKDYPYLQAEDLEFASLYREEDRAWAAPDWPSDVEGVE